MKLFVILSVLLAAAIAKPSGKIILDDGLITKTHSQDEFGNYHFGYNDGQSAKQEERTADGVIRGSYTFVDSNNEIQSIKYTADRFNGFQVYGTNLPIAPEAPIIIDEPIIETAAAEIIDLPKPVEDTPEVMAARAAHLIAVQQARLRNGETKTILKSTSVDEIRGYE